MKRPLLAICLMLLPLLSLYSTAQVGQTISDKQPSADSDAPVPLDIGEVVTGRLSVSDETGKFHYWLVNFQVGSYKVFLDVQRADRTSRNVGGTLQWFSTDRQKLDLACTMNEVDVRFRTVCAVQVKKAFKGVLRYSNSFAVSDYWLGIFKSGADVKAPFFFRPPLILPVSLGVAVSASLDGDQPLLRDAWYVIKLGPRDYRLTMEYTRSDGTSRIVGGYLKTFDADGSGGSSACDANDVDFTTKKVCRLSLAEDKQIFFRISASFTRETVKFRIDQEQ